MKRISAWLPLTSCFLLGFLFPDAANGVGTEVGRGEMYSLIKVDFAGSRRSPGDAPATRAVLFHFQRN